MYNNPYCKPFRCSLCSYPLNYTNQFICNYPCIEEQNNYLCECPYCLNTISTYPNECLSDNLNTYKDIDTRFGGPQQTTPQQFPPQFPTQFPPFQPTPPSIQQPGEAPQIGVPSSPPPSITPQESPQLTAVDPGTIRGCLYRYTYIWPVIGMPYWFYPTRVGRGSVSGYRWNGFMWVYYGTDLRSIRSFTCH